jgi:hypothetical protein
VVQVLGGQAEGPVNENFLLAVPQSFLVEKKSLQKRRSDKIAHLIDKEKKPRDQAVAMAYDMIGEQKGRELDANMLARLREKIRFAVGNVITILPQFDDLKGEDDPRMAEVGPFAQPIVDTLYRLIIDAVKDKEAKDVAAEPTEKQKTSDIQDELTEMSMAAGSVEGGSGGAWINGDFENEQKR